MGLDGGMDHDLSIGWIKEVPDLALILLSKTRELASNSLANVSIQGYEFCLNICGLV